ncbi:hypothetical protein [Stackebrandtia soli]|uniref:hypothetical protein n=1 Tax=Stackebrandtia soli TaxID=1892856 RepID=UPI0039EB7C1A
MFSAPTAGGGIAPRDLVGHLIIAAPHSHETGIETAYGTKDALSLDVADIDTNEVHTGLLWFNGRIVGALKRSLGSLVLGRIVEGVAKPGQAAPFELVDATADAAAVARAQAFMAGHSTFGKQAPAPATPTPAVAAPSPMAAPEGIDPAVLASLDPAARALIESLAAK